MKAMAIIVKITDPIGLLISALIVFMSRKWWIIFVAGAVSALVTETFLALMQSTRVWGMMLPEGFIAATIQASIVYFIRDIFSRRRKS